MQAVSYTHLRAHETSLHLVCRLLLEKRSTVYRRAHSQTTNNYFLMIRRPPRSTHCISSAASDVYKRQHVYFIDNVAFRKPAFQQERYAGLAEKYTDANNAVDGLKSDLSVWGQQCVHSENNRHTATWWVNLESIFSIYYVTIYYKTGNSPWGMYVQMFSKTKTDDKTQLRELIFFQAEDGIRDVERSRGLGDVYKRQHFICLIFI